MISVLHDPNQPKYGTVPGIGPVLRCRVKGPFSDAGYIRVKKVKHNKSDSLPTAVGTTRPLEKEGLND